MNHHFPSISNFPCFLYKNAPKPKICWYCASAIEGKREREEVRTCMGGRENKRARLQIGPDVSVASVSGLALGSQGRQAMCGPATPQTGPSATSGATELVWRTGDITQILMGHQNSCKYVFVFVGAVIRATCQFVCAVTHNVCMLEVMVPINMLSGLKSDSSVENFTKQIFNHSSSVQSALFAAPLINIP